MNTSSTFTDLLPVPRMPSVSQSSMMVKSFRGTMHMRWSMTLSPSRTMQASWFQVEGSTPEEKFQYPDRTMPPSTLRPRPCGYAMPEAMIASGFSPHTSSCAFGSKSASIQWWIDRLPTFHATDESPRPTTSGISNTDTKSSSMPPQRLGWRMRSIPDSCSSARTSGVSCRAASEAGASSRSLGTSVCARRRASSKPTSAKLFAMIRTAS